MAEPIVKTTVHPHRDHTDESLRVERDKADNGVEEKLRTVETEADDVLRTARKRADEVIQTARDNADRANPRQSSASEARAEQARTVADDVLEGERSTADALLERERAKRKRYLDDFLASEREATDSDLIDERDLADGEIAARDDLLATVSHDLRGLLGGLSLNAEALVAHAPLGESGAKLRKHCAVTKRLVGRMERLISDLLDIASIEAGKLAILPERVAVAEILSDTLEAFGPIAAAKRITLVVDGGAAPLEAWLDSGRVLQVLANLMSNAIKFTPAQGEVSIKASTEGAEVLFAVSDTGIGIPEAALEGVFERFRQVSIDRRGLGLGLYISNSIAIAHGGRIWAKSTPGIGSTFFLALPASPQTAP